MNKMNTCTSQLLKMSDESPLRIQHTFDLKQIHTNSTWSPCIQTLTKTWYDEDTEMPSAFFKDTSHLEHLKGTPPRHEACSKVLCTLPSQSVVQRFFAHYLYNQYITFFFFKVLTSFASACALNRHSNTIKYIQRKMSWTFQILYTSLDHSFDSMHSTLPLSRSWATHLCRQPRGNPSEVDSLSRSLTKITWHKIKTVKLLREYICEIPKPKSPRHNLTFR